MRRIILVVAASVGVAWWLFADTYARHFPGPADWPILRFAHFGSYQDYQFWQTIIADFEKSQPGIRLRQEYIPGLGGEYNLKMRQQILTRSPPEIALVQLGPFRELAAHFSEVGDLIAATSPTDSSAELDFDPTALQAFTYEGRLHALPVSGGTLALYGNPRCFERAAAFHGRPILWPAANGTIRDFRELARDLTCDFDGDGVIDQFGFWHPRWIYFLPFLWSFGADITDPRQGHWALRGAQAEAALTFYRDLLGTDRVCPRDDEVPQMFQDLAFLTGRVAMCVNGPWFEPFLAETSLAEVYRVAPIPHGPGGSITRVTWDAIAIAENLSREPDGIARDFVRFVTSREVQKRIGATGRAIPARRSAVEAYMAGDTGGRRTSFVEGLKSARLQPLSPRFSAIDRAIQRHVQSFLDPLRSLSARQCLEEMAEDPAIIDSLRPAAGVDP